MDGNSLKTASRIRTAWQIVDPHQEMKEIMPKATQGQTLDAVAAEKTEHFTSPPKPYSEHTPAAMETAGNKEFDEDTEKKGL